METQTLPTIKYKRAYEKLIADKIINWMYDTIYKPCLDILEAKTVYNDADVIRSALEQGLIYYQDNGFYSRTGRFSNKIAKELEALGAKYSKYRKAYLIEKTKIPLNLLGAIETLKANTFERVVLIQTLLTDFLNNIDNNMKSLVFKDAVNQILTDLQERVYKNAAEKKIELITPKFGIPKPPKNTPSDSDSGNKGDEGANKPPTTSPTISPTPPPDSDNKGGDTGSDEGSKDDKKEENKDTDKDTEKGFDNKGSKQEEQTQYDFINEEFAKNYTKNLDFWIKDWTEERIIKMRETVGQMAIDGKSKKTIAEYLHQQWGVEKRHAEFLARNETAIATTSYLEAKYKSEGFTKFKWQTNIDGRERPLHKELNGQVFRFDDPPIIDARTGQKGLPSQTYNCRCSFSVVADKEFLENRKKLYKAQNSFINVLKGIFK